MLLAALLLGAPVRAAAPRDAVRDLPRILHRSTFETKQAVEDGRQTASTESYHGEWQIEWTPRPVQLRPGTRITPRMRYSGLLADEHQRLSGGGNIRRTDIYDFTLDLSHELAAGRLLAASYALNRSDTLGRGRAFDVAPESSIADTRTAGVRLDLPYDSQLVVGDTTVRTYGGNPSELQTSTLQFHYRPKAAALAQELNFRSDKLASRNYAAGTTNDRAATRISGHRQLDLGRLGRPQISYDFEDDTQQTATENVPLRTVKSHTGLNWQGQVADFPLRYTYNMSQYAQDQSNGVFGPDYLEHWLRFDFEPPADARRLSVGAELRHRDRRDNELESSFARRGLSFTFRPSAKLTSSLNYALESSVLSSALDNETERLEGDLRYEIPGGRASSRLKAEQFTQASRNGNVYNSKLELAHTLKMTDRATFIFGLDQANSDTSALQQGAIDTTSTYLRYSLQGHNGLRLNAGWRQSLLDTEPAHEQSLQAIDLTLFYQPTPVWTYQLSVLSNDRHNVNLQHLGESLQVAEDRVTAVVTFSF